MRKFWLLLRIEAAGWKRYIVWIAVLIVFMIGTVSYVKKQEITREKISLGIANEDTSEYAKLLLSYFNENETFLSYVELMEGTKEELERQFLSGALDAYLVIPEQFAEKMIRMENLPIKAVVSTEYPVKALILRHAMEAYETYIEAVEENCTVLYRMMREKGFTKEECNAANVDISLDLIFTALGKDDFFRERKLETTPAVSYGELYQYSGFYYILVFSLLPAGFRILKLKEKGMSERLKAMHISGGLLDLAVLTPYLLLHLAAILAVCVIKGKPELLPGAVLTMLPWTALVTVLGEKAGSRQRYLFLCSMAVICTALPGGSLIPLELLPESFVKASYLMPNAWFVRLFTELGGAVL